MCPKLAFMKDQISSMRIQIIAISSGIIFTCLFLSSAWGQGDLTVSNKQWMRLDKAMAEAVETLQLPSLSVAVVHNGKLVCGPNPTGFWMHHPKY